MSTGFAAPILFRPGRDGEVLRPVPLDPRGDAKYGEKWLQALFFAHPETLPVTEIDASYAGLIPLCRELDTPVGPVDAVYVTASGRLALLETKLWRNPESRRKVIGQILDYAKELAHWDYSRLDEKVRQARHDRDFAGVSALVARHHPPLVEHRFQDAVTRSLSRGDFLLIIAGDGIREGVNAIAEYLDRNGTLHFTFGIVECAIYETSDGTFFVQPRVLAKTTNVLRTVMVVDDGRGRRLADVDPDEAGAEEDRPDLVESRARYRAFWTEFLDQLRLEASQPLPRPAQSTNQFFRMPVPVAAVSAYLAQSLQEAGVYLRFTPGTDGDRLYDYLLDHKVDIEAALGTKVEWHTREHDNRNWISLRRPFAGNLLTDHRRELQAWLAEQTSRFVSVFRPRLERLARDTELTALS